MKKFLVVYRSPKSAKEKMGESTPEQMEEGMKKWMEWAQKAGEGLVELGSPLGNGQRITEEDCVPSELDIAGYSILQAENMDGAKELLNGHPHLGWTEGCAIELHEMLPLPGQES